MFLFYCVSIFLLIGTVIPKSRQSIYLLVSFFILFYISAYRSLDVGTDTLNYEATFNSISFGVEWLRSEIEIGWIWLNDIVLLFNGDFRTLLIITTLITIFPVFFVAKKYSENPMLTILFYYLLYFYFYSFNIMRQSVSIGLILLSLVALLNNRNKTFIFLVLISSLFHYSALICLCLFFVKLNFERTLIYIVSSLTLIFGLFGVDYLAKLIYITGYSSYIDDYQYGNLLGNSIFLILNNIILFFILFLNRKISDYVKVFFIYIVFLNLFSRIPFGSRVILYFSICQILFYPYFLKNLNINNIYLRVVFYLMIVSLAYLVFFTKLGEGGIIPYSNIL